LILMMSSGNPGDAGLFNWTASWTASWTAAARMGNHGENMGSNGEPEATDSIWSSIWSVDSYKEMEYKLHSLRSLVCDLLRTNQELRDALFDAHGNNAEPRSGNAPR
jgi:hypothetical protein